MSVARIKKELDAIVWPWAAVVLASIVFIVFPEESWSSPIMSLHWMTFWIGIPLLASLSLGHELQYNTLSSLFAQPIDRGTIWREKWVVLIPAVVTASAGHFYADHIINPFGFRHATEIAAWALIAVCGATFWMLVGRSAINGVLLNLIHLAVLVLVVDLAKDFRAFAGIAAVAHAALMLGLSYRKLMTFEVKGTPADVGGAVATSGRLLRSKPAQPLRNLIRKELRLLWPIWFLTALCIPGALLLLAMGYIPGVEKDTPAAIASACASVGCVLLAAIAGSMSSAEERTSGTYVSQRTLPVSMLRLWGVKAGLVVVATSIMWGFPYVLGRFLFGAPFVHDFHGEQILIMAALAAIGFCCGYLANGTLRATVLILPVALVATAAGEKGANFAQSLEAWTSFDTWILSYHPYPFHYRTLQGATIGDPAMWMLFGLAITALLISYSLSRRQSFVKLAQGVTLLLPLFIVAPVAAFGARVPRVVTWRSNQLWNIALQYVPQALQKLPTSAGTRSVSIEEMAAVLPMSGKLRAILELTEISVSRNDFQVRFKDGGICFGKIEIAFPYIKCPYW